jgi:hypothetical protein
MSGLSKILGTYKHRMNPIRNVAWRLFPKKTDMNIVFVVGAPRSGTTLMHRMLSCHSQYFSISRETGFFSMRNYCNFDHFGLGKPEWPAVLDRASEPGEYFQNAIEVIRDRQASNVGTFVEKTPQHVMRLKHILGVFPKAKIIHIIRDGRDCYCSSKSHKYIPQRKSVDCFAKYWRRCLKGRLLCGDDPRIYDIRYEDLAMKPEAKLAELMEFLGNKFEPQQLDPEALSSDVRSGRKFFVRLTEPISSKTVGRWKQELSPEEVATYDKNAGHMLDQFGYV